MHLVTFYDRARYYYPISAGNAKVSLPNTATECV